VLKPTVLLARAFFSRFFESELMQQGIPQVQLVIWSLALVIAPGLLLSLRCALTYSRLRLAEDFAGLRQAMLVDRLLLITISMAVLGLVGLVIWDGVFPDRRDARHLGVLPLPGRLLIVARLLALCAMAGLFLIAVNAIPTLTFGALAAEYGAATSTIRGVIAQGVASMAAGACAFFALIAMQGALLVIVGRQAAERLAVVLQIVMVAALLQLLFLLSLLREVVQAANVANPVDPVMRWIPSLWFLALFDVLSGRPSFGSMQLALRAVIATAAVTVGALALFASTHRRLMRAALESRDAGASGGVRLVQAAIAAIVRVTDRGPLSRAVTAFTLQTMIRSRPHRMLLATYIGFACAIIVSQLGPLLIREGWSALREPGLVLLAVPFVLQFCAIIGARLVLAIPVEPRANWIIRLYEPRDRQRTIDAVRDVLLATIVMPIALASGIIALALWSPWWALVHVVMCAGMGWLLTESVLTGFRKIPFVCTYYPGRSRMRTLWPFYLVALIAYSSGAAAIERVVASHPFALVPLVACLAIAINVLIRLRAWLLAQPFGLRFEEEDPDALFAGFKLLA
jgi:hypothetical protein